jgi:hypothetical protein
MRTLTTLICVGFLMASAPPRALAGVDRGSRPAVQIDAAAIQDGARTRVFVESPRGDETKLLELKQQLLSLGAIRVNVFLPSVLVCDVVEGTELGWIENDPDLLCVRSADVDAQRGPAVSPSLALVMDSYAYAKKLVESGGEPVDRRAGLQKVTTTAGEFTDLVLEAPREIVDLSARLQDDGSPGHAAFAERDLRQNSEFLIGNVMIQLVLPESMGAEEDWTDQDLAEAIAGAYAGALAYQQRFGYAPINFVLRAQRRVPCDYEPILSNLETDETWISDVMLELGYRDTDTYLLAVHQYNNAGRKAYGTDWVFTAFIACSRNQEKHTFRGANYVAYAWGGGPHLVIPFPAASYPQYTYTEREIFSMIFQHEMGHIFWALDEYPSSPSECGWRAGYLDYPNRNKFSVDFDGVPHGCPDVDDLEFCVMMNAIQAARPVCYYTTGQIGLADANGNSVPDVFDAPPVIEFEGSDSETLQAGEITVNMRALATIVPNKNPSRRPGSVTARPSWTRPRG